MVPGEYQESGAPVNSKATVCGTPGLVISYWLGVLALAFVTSGSPEPSKPSSARALADALRVELLTMGPGKETYSRFGHSALRVTHLGGKGDLVYNFGTFEDDSPDAVRAFLRGRLRYWLSVETFSEAIKEYREDGRRLIGQELALTREETRALFKRLRHLAQPENRAYDYDHYRANCSTRIRDELDRATGGLFRRQLGGRPAATHRHWLRRATLGAPGFHLAFDLVLTRSDRPIDAWEAGFAPEQLMRGVASIHRAGENGTPSGPLVRSTRELLPGPGFGQGGRVHPWSLVAGFSLGLVLWILLPPLVWRRSSLAWRSTGVALAVTGLTQTALAALMLSLWILSTLPVFRANPSLVLCPPTAIGLVVGGLRLAIRPPPRWKIPWWLVLVLTLQVLAIFGYGLIRVAQEAPQGNSELLWASMVVSLASAGALLLGRGWWQGIGPPG